MTAMLKPAIAAEGLGKQYVIRHEQETERYTALRDVIAQKARGAWQSLTRGGGERRKRSTESFRALDDLTFAIEPGEVTGVMGRNGAGKSTLLKVLSRITEPSTGRVTIRGRVASLLEVGTGFHPELTGRENIYLNGAILGMSRGEVRRQFDEIVAFADVERFLDTPVKRYSSGMYMRLAFSVAAFLESDILIVDEVLAVGDAAFQKKCLGRMEDVSSSGRTVLFVSHNIGSLLNICRTGLLLEAGRLVASGAIRDVAQAYQRLGETGGTTLSRKAFRGPLADVTFETIQINGRLASGPMFVDPAQAIAFVIRGTAATRIPNFRFAIALLKDGVRVFTVHDGPETLAEGPFELALTVPAMLLRPGDYMVSLGARRVDGNDWVWGSDLAVLTVADDWSSGHDPDDIGIIALGTALSRRVPMPEAGAA